MSNVRTLPVGDTREQRHSKLGTQAGWFQSHPFRRYNSNNINNNVNDDDADDGDKNYNDKDEENGDNDNDNDNDDNR